MPQLSDKSIFQLRPLLRNFATKKSAFVQDRRGRNILCLVDGNNRICLHCASDYDGGGDGNSAAEEEEVEEVAGGASEAAAGGDNDKELSRPHQVLLRTCSWFQTNRKQVQDMCFDPSGTMLLVLCK